MPTESLRSLLIANPSSGSGVLGRRWGRVASIIRGELGPFEHRFTRGPGDASTLAREGLAAGYEMIVAMGGDGTISEVVDGFFDGERAIRPDAVLGVLHYGTGGDFCRTIGAPKQLRAGARALRGRAADPIDVGRLRYTGDGGAQRLRHFINIASFGIAGLVDQYVNRSSKLLGGRFSFAWATLQALRRYRPQTARIALDGGDPHEVQLHNVAIANGRYFGGGMQVAPHAKLDDGQFDVITLGPMGIGRALTQGHRLYAGTHLEMEQVTEKRARRVVAEPADGSEEILLDVDGETPGRLPASFELLPGALRLKRHEVLP